MENIGKILSPNDLLDKQNRLNNIWKLCDFFAPKGELENLRWQLDRAFVSLHYDINKLKPEYIDEIEKLDNKISSSRKKDDTYNYLKQKEILLKEVQQIGIDNDKKR